MRKQFMKKKIPELENLLLQSLEINYFLPVNITIATLGVLDLKTEEIGEKVMEKIVRK